MTWGVGWAGVQPAANGWMFRRGFVWEPPHMMRVPCGVRKFGFACKLLM